MSIPGTRAIKDGFKRFSDALPNLSDRTGLHRDSLEFRDYVTLVEEWAATG
jgi:hypothetical protein